MKKTSGIAASLALILALGCGGEQGAAESASESAETEVAAAAQPEGAEAQPAEPATVAQSTGSQTEVVEGDRPTLVDREIGVQITCPPDRTWRCRLESDGQWKLRDMSSNTLNVRVVGPAADAAAALEQEIAYAREELPVTEVTSQEGDTAVLAIGPNPGWARPVERTGWIQVKQVGDRFYACHGLGSEGNFDNARGDYEALCGSLSAVE